MFDSIYELCACHVKLHTKFNSLAFQQFLKLRYRTSTTKIKTSTSFSEITNRINVSIYFLCMSGEKVYLILASYLPNMYRAHTQYK